MSSMSTSNLDLTPTQLRLLEKQQEYASLQALKEASGLMLDRVEELARMSHVMADGGAAVGSVLRNWNQVFSILNLFDKPPTSDPSEPNPKSKSKPPVTPTGAGEPTPVDIEEEEEEELPLLVRLQFDKYQAQASASAASQGQGQGEGDGQDV